ncbi:MAG: hydrogenase maturation nickel metallochaperone HypA [Eubacterium sp.]|nr:hydrogenase maturation nickel metallochaperone HypA [Eubacterium sp.]
MHELSVTTNILNLALEKLKEQELTQIHSISLKIGVMQGYEKQWMQHFFERLSKGTPAEGARLEVEIVPITFRCRDCGCEFAFDAHGTDDCSCPGCHGISYEMISGKEFSIEQMEAS